MSKTSVKSAMITSRTDITNLAIIAQWFEKQGIKFNSAYEFLDTIVTEFAKAAIADNSTIKKMSIADSDKYLYECGIKHTHQGKLGKTDFLKALKLEKLEAEREDLEPEIVVLEEEQ